MKADADTTSTEGAIPPVPAEEKAQLPAEEKAHRPGLRLVSGAVSTGTSAIKDVAVVALKELRGVFRFWAAAVGISAIAIMVPSVMLIAKNQPGYGVLLLLALLVVIALSVLVPVWRLGEALLQEKSQAPSPSSVIDVPAERGFARPDPSWFRLVPKVALTESQRHEVQELLTVIRREALDVIRNHLGCRVDSDGMVRANIFVPDITSLSTGRLCELYIPDGFSIGLEQPETQLRFWPNQGLTGVVFVAQIAEAACSEAAADGRIWESRYNLTDVQKEIIHRDLRWIASLPLKVGDGKDSRAVAVLNIDGVGFDLERTQVEALIGKLIGYAGALAGKFQALGCQRLAIYVEEMEA